ncbi:hypothetical protein [Bifidobacterium xylocopae]|uniref:Colicin transporter n=1 Tax=Bifidobacterium xylocopae TaxID=2493119 RepID=A0A366KB46_9BIFI|nr:hypothetical protein [Bifidobacterium xylocopae]RBP98819.1 hypothetical protein CRD59_07140 [Bifidobacterium xylocopae]
MKTQDPPSTPAAVRLTSRGGSITINGTSTELPTCSSLDDARQEADARLALLTKLNRTDTAVEYHLPDGSTEKLLIHPDGSTQQTDVVAGAPSKQKDKGGKQAAPTSPAKRSGRASVRRTLAVSTVVALLAASAAAAYLVEVQTPRARHDGAVAACQEAAGRLERAGRAGESKRAAGARDVQAGQVADAKTVSDYQRAVKAITKVKPVSCDASQSTADLREAARRMDAAAARRDDQAKAVERAAKAVLASRDAKSLADARAALKTKQDEGSKLLADSEGKAADNGTRDRLRGAIDAAGKVSSSKPDDYRKAQAAIQASIDAVNASMQAKADADAQAAAQSTQAAPPTPATPNYPKTVPQVPAPMPAPRVQAPQTRPQAPWSVPAPAPSDGPLPDHL